MTSMLTQIMLIDDCAADNYLHRRVIRDVGAASEIIVMPSADEALAHLHDCRSRGRPAPELIFLDINTPGIEGWSFLEAFHRDHQHALDDTVIVMLSGSLNPDDRERAERSPLVREYLPKPLTREALGAILGRHFSSSAARH